MKDFILKFLPVGLQDKIKQNQSLQDILTNTGWLFADKIVRMGIGVFVGIWVARYLGPDQFGILNFAAAFVALFGVIAGLGLNSIVVRDLVNEAECAGAILGSAFFLQWIAGALAYALVVVTIFVFQPEDELARVIVMVLGLMLIVKASEVVKYWFESQVLSKYTVWIESSIYLVVSAIQVFLILNHATLMAFVWVTVAGAVFVSIGLFGVYRWNAAEIGKWRIGGIGAWRFDYSRAKTLLKDSWPLLLSGMAIMVYMRIDQVMLGQMLGVESVGIYSAAVRISEVWYFIPMAITASVFPSVIKIKKESEQKYIYRFQRLFNIMVMLGVAVAIPVTFFSDWIITLLFGPDYINAGAVLVIHIWSGIFVSLGIISGMWLVNENLQRFAFYRAVVGVIVNIVANIFLIPYFGVVGAAVGTLLSQFIAAYMFDLFNTKTRAIFWMKTRAFYSFFHIIDKKGQVS